MKSIHQENSNDSSENVHGDETIRKKLRKIVKNADIDFKACVAEMGYVKAREHLKKIQINSHLKIIDTADSKAIVSRRNERLKEAIRLSNTLGEPDSESAIDKIMEASNRPIPAFLKSKSAEYISQYMDNDTSLRRAMITRDLTIANSGIDQIPSGLGDTLFLQV